ncbi:RNA polymerase Rpc34 subunit-domain-containing protein [Mycena rebaudengoi]|nr:RNA polymerase Rpc34 subunit-domain-containing protein [Mycena rebaudengoi]
MSRRISEVETKLHQAALAGPKNEITSKQAESVVPDAKARQTALNFLLSAGLFKPLKDAKGNVIFRAVTKGELEQTKDLNGEESLVLGHIKVANNEGIWTKHLKAKTNLHQTIIDRCLKTLTQKKLIKRVPSVQHPTRKIYMLEHIEPSVGLTGGPWYTESELDTVFIETISRACLKFIRDVSFPKQRQGREGALFPISNAPRYPTAAQVHNTLRQARLTETELSVEHVEMLLNVLVLDGEIETLPSFGASLWDANAVDDGGSGDEDEQQSKKKKKKRRRSSSDEEDETDAKAKRKKRRADTDSDDDDESASRKKAKLKRKKVEDSDESSSEPDSPKKKKKKKKKTVESTEEESDEEGTSRKKKKKKKVKQESSTEASDSEAENNRSRRKKSSKRSPSPFDSYAFLDGAGAVVYRAINQEKTSVGWSQAPCSKCPSFEFCKEGGPVNPTECVYYGDWLVAGTVAIDDDP